MLSTHSRLAILTVLLIGYAAPVVAQDRLFPHVRSFERPQASPHLYGVVGRLLSVEEGDSRYGVGREAEVGLGENFPILALGQKPIVLGFGTEVYGRFSLDDSRTALISNDWSVGVNAGVNLGAWDLTLELYHESSHLGDEYGDRFQEERLDWTREALAAWVSYTAGHWRFTGSASQVLIDGLGLHPLGGALGIDYRGTWGRILGSTLRPLGGFFTEADAATKWQLSTSVRLGVALSAAEEGRELAFSVIGHSGLSTQRQFFRRQSQYLGFEIRFDL